MKKLGAFVQCLYVVGISGQFTPAVKLLVRPGFCSQPEHLSHWQAASYHPLLSFSPDKVPLGCSILFTAPHWKKKDLCQFVTIAVKAM